MGWILCLAMIFGFVFNGDPFWLIAAGLFAISGGLSEVGVAIKRYL